MSKRSRKSSGAADPAAPPSKKAKLEPAMTRTDPKTGNIGPWRKKDDEYWMNFTRRALQKKLKREEARAQRAKRAAVRKKESEEKEKKVQEKQEKGDSDTEVDSDDEPDQELKRDDKTKFVPFHALTTRFKEHVCLIAGGGRGIGRACALRLAQEGGIIYILDRTRWKETVEEVSKAQELLHAKRYQDALAAYHAECDKLAKAQAKAGSKSPSKAAAKPKKPRRIKFKPKVFHIQCDVTKPKEVQAAIEKVVKERGYIDVVLNLVNTTGKDYGETDSHSVKYEQFDRVLQMNLYGTFNMCQAVLPYMTKEKYGRIVNLAAQDGKAGAPKCTAYAAAKAAIINLTKTLGQEYAGSGVTVNCVAPQYDEYHAKKLGKVYAQKAEKVPMGRAIDMEELAGAVAFICSEENTYTTGFCYDLTGGTATY